MSDHVGTAVDFRRGLVLGQIGHSIAAKPTDIVMVHDMGFCIRISMVVVGVGRRYQEGFKVANEVKNLEDVVYRSL